MEIDVKHVIHTEKFTRVLSENTFSVLANVALGLLVIYVQMLQANAAVNLIYFWCSSLLIICGVRLIIGRYFQKNPAKSHQQEVDRLNFLRVSIIVTSLCWGANAYLAVSRQSTEMLFFCSFIILGVSSSAALSYVIDKISAMAYLLFAVLPLLIYQISLGTAVSNVMGVVGLIYIVFMYHKVNVLNTYLIANILMRVEAEQHDMQIRQMAFQDALTGLPNRRLMHDRLSHALHLSKRNHTSGAVVFIDLDYFKEINDAKGHAIGDMILQQVAHRLTALVRESDTVARFGGDEFVIVLQNLDPQTASVREQVQKVINKILEEIHRPFILKNETFLISTSIGVALFDAHGETPDELLKHADAAMYQAKNAGRHAAIIFDAVSEH